jgi:uncharacterized protein YidB (DUF937 family)
MGIFDVLGGGNRGGGGMSPVTLALLGVLAYRTMKGKGRLADMLGTGPNAPAAANTSGTAGQASPDTGPGGLGGLGGALSSGLKDLLDRFRQTGHEEKAQSWVTTGANRRLLPTSSNRR